MLFLKKPDIQRLSSKNDLKGLIRSLKYKKDWTIRRDAVHALSRINDTKKIQPLIKCLEDSSDSVRFEAIYALGDLGVVEAIPKIIERLKEPGDQSIIAATRVLKNAKTVSAVPYLLALLKHQEASVRKEVVEALGTLGDPSVFESIKKALNDDSTSVIKKAVNALFRLDPGKTLSELDAILQEVEPNARIGIFEHINKINPDIASDVILKHFISEKADSVKCKMVEMLSEKKDPKAIEIIIPLLTSPNHKVRICATKTLNVLGYIPGKDMYSAIYYLENNQFAECIKIGEPAVLPLIDVIKSTGDQAKSFQAADILVKIGVPSVDHLIEALKTGKENEQTLFAEILGSIGNERAIEPLIRIIKEASHSYTVRKIAVNSLAAIRNESAIPGLIDLLIERSLSDDAMVALLSIGPASIPALILKLYPDHSLGKWHNREMSEACSKVLVKFGAVAVEPLKKELLLCPNKYLVNSTLKMMDWQPSMDKYGAAYWAIENKWDKCLKIGDEAVEALIMFIRNNDLSKSEYYINYVTHCRYEDAVKTLIKIGKTGVRALADELQNDPTMGYDIRNYIVDKLLKTMDSYLVGVFMSMLKSNNHSLREEACKTLGKLSSEEAIQPLVEVMNNKHEDQSMRIQACDALGTLKSVKAIQPLIEFLKNEEENVYIRSQAANALGQIDNPEAVKALLSFFESPSNEIRTAVSKALIKQGWIPETKEARIQFYFAMGRYSDCLNLGTDIIDLFVREVKRWNNTTIATQLSQVPQHVRKPFIEALKKEGIYLYPWKPENYPGHIHNYLYTCIDCGNSLYECSTLGEIYHYSTSRPAGTCCGNIPEKDIKFHPSPPPLD